jgi:hypothetical protein
MATFPIPNVIVKFTNGDCFRTEHADCLYNLHLELQDHYPSLPRGGFRLDLVEENEEEEYAIFQLVIADDHLDVNVLLDQMGEVLIFEVMFSWSDPEEEYDEPCDSWSMLIAMDPANRSFYGECADGGDTIVKWHSTLKDAICSKESYSNGIIRMIQKEIDTLLEELEA